LIIIAAEANMERDTKQRDAIRQVLADEGRPLSVNELLELAQSRVPGLGIATVYRNLKALTAEQRVVQVSLPGEPPRWEAAPEGHHHHFLCRTCDKLFEINDCPADLKRLLPEGYTLEEHDILLRGQCGACSANPGYATRHSAG
jgi:Fur family ferric uptake transcriptional regulator